MIDIKVKLILLLVAVSTHFACGELIYKELNFGNPNEEELLTSRAADILGAYLSRLRDSDSDSDSSPTLAYLERSPQANWPQASRGGADELQATDWDEYGRVLRQLGASYEIEIEASKRDELPISAPCNNPEDFGLLEGNSSLLHGLTRLVVIAERADPSGHEQHPEGANRGEYIDRPLALIGHQYVQGGAGEGHQLLGPDGSFENVQVIKTDHAVPSYCNPPNPCPIGYTAKDGCLERFINSASYSREYQARQRCECDSEHSLFECASSVPSRGASTMDYLGGAASPEDQSRDQDNEVEVDAKLSTLARAIQNRYGDLGALKKLMGSVAGEGDVQPKGRFGRAARGLSRAELD